MAIYRKKPVLVEAVQWKGTAKSWDEVHDLGDIKWEPGPMGEYSFFVITHEGKMKAENGDWIIKEPFPTDDRHFYPCKPDIFEETYEKVEE